MEERRTDGERLVQRVRGREERWEEINSGRER
jgi:hypothetical protein